MSRTIESLTAELVRAKDLTDERKAARDLAHAQWVEALEQEREVRELLRLEQQTRFGSSMERFVDLVRRGVPAGLASEMARAEVS